MTVQDKDYAHALQQMCDTVFKSCNNGGNGIGNCNDESGNFQTRSTILDFVEQFPIIKEQCENSDPSDDNIIDVVMEINYELMGGSEYYYSRISESCVVTFSETDVEVDEVKFN
jgi:hypothetical protein